MPAGAGPLGLGSQVSGEVDLGCEFGKIWAGLQAGRNPEIQGFFAAFCHLWKSDINPYTDSLPKTGTLTAVELPDESPR